MIVDASALALRVPVQGADPGLRRRLQRTFEAAARLGELVAPRLAAYELGNVIHRKRGAEIPGGVERRSKILAELLVPPLLVPSAAEHLETAGRIAERAQISFYDASYLAHAKLGRTMLVTADSGQYEHARALGIEAALMPDQLQKVEALYPSSTDNGDVS